MVEYVEYKVCRICASDAGIQAGKIARMEGLVSEAKNKILRGVQTTLEGCVSLQKVSKPSSHRTSFIEGNLITVIWPPEEKNAKK